MDICIIDSQLNKKRDKSLAIAALLEKKIATLNYSFTKIDLATEDLVPCDGYACYQNKTVQAISQRIKAAQSCILISPVYCYDVNAAAKNLIELTGQAWKDKIVSIVLTAGGAKSYMAPLSFMNSLLLDFRCIINPRYVYLESSDFDANHQLQNSDTIARLNAVIDFHHRFKTLV